MTRLVTNLAGCTVAAVLLVSAGGAQADSRLFGARSSEAGVSVVGARIDGKTLSIAGQGGSVTFFRIDNPGGSVPCANRITFLGTGGKTATVDADICANGSEVTVSFASATPPPPPSGGAADTGAPAAPQPPAASATPPSGNVTVTIATDDPNIGIDQIFIAGQPVAINQRVGNAVEILVAPGPGGLECRRDLGLVLDDGRRVAREVNICANDNSVVVELTGSSGGSGSAAAPAAPGTPAIPPASGPAASVDAAAQWKYVSSRDNGSLSFAVPGTDASEFTAVCTPQSDAVTVALGRSAPEVTPGSDVSVILSAGAYSGTYTAVGSDTSGTSDISNPLISMTTADPFWPALIRENALTIQIGSAAPYTLPLRGSGAEARQFLGFCSPATATPPPSAAQPPSEPLRAESGIRFFCADGSQIRVIFDDANDRVLVSDGGAVMMPLGRVASRVGARYVGNGFELVGRAEDITWRRPGGARAVCDPGR